MKLKLPPLKLPTFKLPAFRRGRPIPRAPRVMRATARRASPQAFEDYDEEEPTTRLSSAFIVVLVLHLVAIGGILAFKGVKSHRESQEILAGPAPAKPAPANVAAAATNSDAAYVASATPAPVHTQNSAPVPISGARVHHVKAGESLLKLAFAYNVTPLELANANGLKETSILHAGQVLNIPAAHTAVKPAVATSKNLADQKTLADLRSAKTYTVGKGESPVGIARKLGVSYDELMKLNKIDDPKKLQIGQVLKVPAKAPKAPESI